MSIVLKTPSNGSVTLSEQDTAGDVVVTIPAVTATMLTTATAGVPIGGPAFQAYLASAQAAPTAATWTKINFDTELFDTNSNFASGRFTPTVAGYYQINSVVHFSSGSTGLTGIAIYKNGSSYQQGLTISVSILYANSVSAIVYLNGSTDYVETYVYVSNTTTLGAGSGTTTISGALVRSAT